VRLVLGVSNPDIQNRKVARNANDTCCCTVQVAGVRNLREKGMVRGKVCTRGVRNIYSDVVDGSR
jgi:hypothetical protein